MLIASLLLELLLVVPIIWRLRAIWVVVLVTVVPGLSVVYMFNQPGWLAVGVVVLTLARVFNLLRIAQGRMHAQYLRRAVLRTSVVLLAVQGLFVGLEYAFTFGPTLWQLALLQAVVALSLLIFTIRNIYKTRYRSSPTAYADRELPTVSVLIPARNETDDLEACLRSVLASDYPKLEIIVLDDCSHVRTSEIIKSFAHAGVRFVRGDEPRPSWLAKNQAYEKLAADASGDYLLFCGVDVRFGPSAVKSLVTTALARNKQMISVLPHRLSGNIAGAFIQPMRYWWELALPRKMLNRPAVLSSCWLIDVLLYEQSGGMSAVSRSVVPEAHFARAAVAKDTYSFIRAGDSLDIQTRKSLTEQRATALRMHYPQLRRRPENVLGLAVLAILCILAPFVVAVVGLVTGSVGVFVPALLAVSALFATHVLIVYTTSPANVLIAAATLPLEIILDIALTLESMYRYEFGTVEWKDRNICIPVMHVVPRLPKTE